MGTLVGAGDTRIHVEERGTGDLPLFVIHGGPGLDHTMFGDHLDELGDDCRLLLIDLRGHARSDPAPPETWTLARQARDVHDLAKSLGIADRYAVLGHSYGAFVALQHAVDFSGEPAASIISSGVASSAHFVADIDEALANFEPEELRAQVAGSWEREATVQTSAEIQALLRDQFPFHFADPRDPRIAQVDLREMIGAPEILRHGASNEYGEVDLEDRLADIHHPVLVIAGRHERTCPLEENQLMADGIPEAEMVVLEHSAHMGFIEEQDAYVAAVREFLARRT